MVKYENIVPWGRSFDEYVQMFSLTELDLQKSILGCGDGPASFNAVLNSQGGNVISIDPIYQFSADEIKTRIDETFQQVIKKTAENQNLFVWNKIANIDELMQLRLSAMDLFLADYQRKESENRYVFGELPNLPVKGKSFELALVSHLLFLYSDNLNEDFHCKSIKELMRVADEIRIFPIIDLDNQTSKHLDAVCEIIRNENWQFEIREVDYEFQKGGNKMLRIFKK